MGLTTQIATVRPSRSARAHVEIEFWVDSGAVYSLVPGAALRKLGLRPYRTESFTLADGTKVKRRVGDAYFEINGNRGPAPVIFGEKGDEPLLGVTTSCGWTCASAAVAPPSSTSRNSAFRSDRVCVVIFPSARAYPQTIARLARARPSRSGADTLYTHKHLN